MISTVSHMLYVHTMATETPSQLKMTHPLRWSSPYSSTGLEKIPQAIHERHMGINKYQNRARYCVYWPGINSGIKCLIESCPTCQHHYLQEPQQMVQPKLAPECPWQLLSTDYFHFDGSEYLVVAMPPRPSQSWRNSLQNMASERYSITTMAPSLPMHSSLSLP